MSCFRLHRYPSLTMFTYKSRMDASQLPNGFECMRTRYSSHEIRVSSPNSGAPQARDSTAIIAFQAGISARICPVSSAPHKSLLSRLARSARQLIFFSISIHLRFLPSLCFKFPDVDSSLYMQMGTLFSRCSPVLRLLPSSRSTSSSSHVSGRTDETPEALHSAKDSASPFGFAVCVRCVFLIRCSDAKSAVVVDTFASDASK